MNLKKMMKRANELEDEGRRGMFIFTVNKPGIESTRVAVGCPEQAATVFQRLSDAGFTVVETYDVVPERSEEEKLRASRILGELFGN